MVFWKCARRPFSMHEETAPRAMDFMFLELRDVVTDIVHDPEIAVAENSFKCPASQVCHDLTIRKGKVCRGSHCSEVLLALPGCYRNARELPVDYRYSVLFHSLLHEIEI